VIDLLLAVVLVAYAASGYRRGAVVGIGSLAGFVGGAALAMWGLPIALERWSAVETDDLRRLGLRVVGVLVAAFVGQAVGSALGARLRHAMTAAPARTLDSLLGAVASVLAVCLLVWLLAGALRTGPSPALSRAVSQSKVVGLLDSVLPPAGARVFAGFRNLLDAEGFPRVFQGFGPERIRPVEPPDPRVRAGAGIRAAARSVVKISGTAVACGRAQEGSGWVLTSGRVVTNAHVVAGMPRPRIRVGGVGPSYRGQVVVFDPVRDLAVIDVPGLPAPALARAGDLRRGASAVVAGFPLDGPYRLDAARVREVLDARGEDIYGRRTSVREVYSLYARVRPGNSGGPLLSADGEVVGIVFAKSLDADDTGYALTMDEAGPVLVAGRTADDPVDVGGCAAG
jgi:S1-C subfamily serine protease